MWTHYFIDTDPDQKNTDDDENVRRKKADAPYTLFRQLYADPLYSSDHDWAKIPKQKLLTNLKSFKFSVWDEEKNKFVDKIDLLSDKSKFLKAVKLSLEWIDRNGNSYTFTRIFRPLWPNYKAEESQIRSETGEDQGITSDEEEEGS
jgi:hypothetical protein